MVAYNFRAQFAAKIEAGDKLQTIRKSRRCKPGDVLQMYIGQRTKSCRLLIEAVCTSVMCVTIDDDGISTWGEGVKITSITDGYGLDEFAKADGFKNWDAMREFFHFNYELPFNGYLIKWRKK